MDALLKLFVSERVLTAADRSISEMKMMRLVGMPASMAT